jgi:hypothetical protein
MYGRIGAYGERSCSCCDFGQDKRTLRRTEDAQWRREAMEEMTDPAHANGICSDPKTGMAGCGWCYGDDDYDSNDNSDLDGIPGVWCSLDWRNS